MGSLQSPFRTIQTHDMPKYPLKHCFDPLCPIGHLKRVAKENLQNLSFISEMQMPQEVYVHLKLKGNASNLNDEVE